MKTREKYERTLRQIQYAAYPATLGTISIGLYQFIKNIEQTVFFSPETPFLFGGIFFFFTSILIGLGIGQLENSKENEKLLARQTFAITILFIFGVVLDLLGIIFLMSLSSHIV